MLYSVGTSTEQNTEEVLKNDHKTQGAKPEICFHRCSRNTYSRLFMDLHSRYCPIYSAIAGRFSAVGLLCWCALPLTVLNLLKIAGAVVLTDRLSKVVK